MGLVEHGFAGTSSPPVVDRHAGGYVLILWLLARCDCENFGLCATGYASVRPSRGRRGDTGIASGTLTLSCCNALASPQDVRLTADSPASLHQQHRIPSSL